MSSEARKMKRVRELLGLTQEHLAKFLHVPRRRVSDWESGKREIDGPVRRLLTMMEGEPDYFRVRFFGATPGCPDIRKAERSYRC